MKINLKTILGAVAGLGLTAWAAKSMFGKDKAEGETTENTEDTGDVEVEDVEDVEVEA